jgi:NAD(P)-dependent dehydrogenase (short-subunit alcohol dehydrogenase family)
VADYAQVQALWDAALAGLGSVDIWVNNAGADGMKVPFFMMPPDNYVKTINTNVIGLMNGNRVAIPGMYKQGSGMIWNMEGFGSNGSVRPTLSVYGASKYAVAYFTKALAKELGKTPGECRLSEPWHRRDRFACAAARTAEQKLGTVKEDPQHPGRYG